MTIDTTAMVRRPDATDPTRAFEPNSIEEASRLAKILVASRLMPEGASTPEAAFTVIMTGRELGLTAMQSIRSIHVIKGKAMLSADLVAALVKTRGDVCRYFRMVESTNEVARYETLRVGEPAPTTMAFTIEDAKRAHLTGKPESNWSKYPAAMLRARCITSLARAVYPDLAMGLYDPDEIQEAAPAPRGPAVRVEQAAPEAATPEPPKLAPGPGPDAATGVFLHLCDLIDGAESAAELNAIAREVQKAHRAGDIDESQMATLRDAVTTKRRLLAATAAAEADAEAAPDA